MFARDLVGAAFTMLVLAVPAHGQATPHGRMMAKQALRRGGRAGVALLLTLLVGIAVTAPARAQTSPPVEAFGSLEAVTDAAISADGRYVALAMNDASGESNVMVADLDNRGTALSFGAQDDTKLLGVGWADDHHVAFLQRQTFPPGAVLPQGVSFVGNPRRIDYYRYGVINIDTRHSELLTTDPSAQWADQGSTLIAPIVGDPGHGRLIGMTGGANLRASVFRVDFSNGQVRQMDTGSTADTVGYLLGEDGAPAVRIDADDRTNRWSLSVYENGASRVMLEGVSETGYPELSLRGILNDGRLAALAFDQAGQIVTLAAVDRATGARTVLVRREGLDVDDAILDPWTRRVVGASWISDEREQSFLDPDLQAAYNAARAAMGGPAQLRSWSRDRRRFLVYAERGLDGGGYYLFEPPGTDMTLLARRFPALEGVPQGVRQAITYRARDGVRIPAYLTLPPDVEPRGLPLVVLVHGGPATRDDLTFDWWAAFLASRGYAVLQPNFRGSSGYGAAWEDAGRGQWGGLMQTDLEDGRAALGRAGMIDPARVCIVGASYGGYAALAGATLTPALYRCAVSVAGISDLIEFIEQEVAETGGSQSRTADYWRLSIGDRGEDRERIRTVSPINLADRVQAPILLMHGTDDSVVPLDQSRRMYDRLRGAGKDARLVLLRGDDHNLSDAETRIQMLRELEGFLALHLGPPS
jgi:dipeptidyl aminopeptidase/acylaminoacyl peptidase